MKAMETSSDAPPSQTIPAAQAKVVLVPPLVLMNDHRLGQFFSDPTPSGQVRVGPKPGLTRPVDSPRQEVNTKNEPQIVIQERGEIFFFYRPKVDKEEAHSADDVQRLYCATAGVR
ncbi:hypothetical protein CMV_019246 [Castanea mollissima]|uniref:Uncharacterized protein n=1 Tax=Castanea mollissima TaxID=60419 RepID=A0A8J4VBQ2_9ROSI|nr:hypothetical protein CMV_019246 [Castanea mollissima]